MLCQLVRRLHDSALYCLDNHNTAILQYTAEILSTTLKYYTTLLIYVALSDPGTLEFGYVLGQSPRDWRTTMN